LNLPPKADFPQNCIFNLHQSEEENKLRIILKCNSSEKFKKYFPKNWFEMCSMDLEVVVINTCHCSKFHKATKCA
jgi:hypothetical protein